ARVVIGLAPTKQRTEYGSVAARRQLQAGEPDAMPRAAPELAACETAPDSARGAALQGQGPRPGRLSRGARRPRHARGEHNLPRGSSESASPGAWEAYERAPRR